MSSFWSSPCSACKYLRRKCTHSCVLAPYFPPHEPYKFLCVHRVFGASNTTKMLNDISPEQREALVSTLVYMADAQIKNSVYGSVGYISLLQLQQELVQLSMRFDEATKKLATYIGPAAVDPFRFSAPAPAQFHHPQFQGSAHFAEQQMMGLGLATGATTPQPMIWNQAQWQRLVEARQRLVEARQMLVEAWQMMEVAQQMMEVAASDAAQEQQMFGSYDQQQQQELLRLSNVEQLGGGVTVAVDKATESAGGLSLHPPSHHLQNIPSSTPSKET